MGFGQSLAVTPLQMLAAYSTVANGGYLVKPHLVKARMRPDGSMEQVNWPRKQVCSAETAKLMRGYLERVVTQGTAKNAKIPGYRLAGKTGTAQKVGERGYGGGRYIGSFIGFMPVEHPRLTMIAVIDEPKGQHYGAVVAAPVVREVGKRAMQYLNILPTETTEKPGHHAAEAPHTH
jgi:cell division protein FtsI/penicillin-binding protein 2